MSPSNAEATQISQAIEFAAGMAEEARGGVTSMETFTESLTAGEVTGRPLTLAAAAQDLYGQIAVMFDRLRTELERHLVIAESYAAVPDAGNKHFLEAGGAQEDGGSTAGNLVMENPQQPHQSESAATEHREPSLADLRRGGRFGQHVLPDRADDMLVERLVRIVFKPQPMFPGLPCKDPCHPALVQQLLDHAPQTDRTGVDDWDRPLRADEVAAIYGTRMEGDPLDVRIAWLRRADELCRDWGKPLAGPGGLVPDMTLPSTGADRRHQNPS